MLSREFTTKEKILLLVCALLALGVVYYQFVFKGVRQQISNYATDALEAEIETEQMRAVKIKEMESVIEANQGREIGDLMVYNNLAAEINMISSITNKKAEKVSVTWDTPVLKGTTVRRGFSITFQTNRYANMKEILDAFNTCKYRCIIHDLSVADNSPTTRSVVARVGGKMTKINVVNMRRGIRHSTQLNVSFKGTFFETVEGALTREGLIIDKSSQSDEPGALETRAKAYE